MLKQILISRLKRLPKFSRDSDETICDKIHSQNIFFQYLVDEFESYETSKLKLKNSLITKLGLPPEDITLFFQQE